MADNKPKFTRKQAITLATLSWKDRADAIVRFDSHIYEGKPINTKGEEAKKPARLAQVTDLDSGEQMEMLVPKVLESILTEKVEGDYLGRWYEIHKILPKREGKDYHEFRVYEIEPAVKGDKAEAK